MMRGRIEDERSLEVSGDLAPSGLFVVAAPASEVVEVRVDGIGIAPSDGAGTYRVPPSAVAGAPISIAAGSLSRRLKVVDPGPTTWVFLLGGQSNMVSRSDADGSEPWPERVRFVAQDGRPIAPSAAVGSADGDSGPFLIAKRFSRDFLAARPGDEVVFVPGAVGGTSFWNERWNPGDDLYENLVALAKTVLAANPTWRLRAMLFQGFETDAKNGMEAGVFRGKFLRLVESVRTDLRAAQLPIVFGELPAGFVGAHADRVAIRDEVLRAPTSLPYTAVASSRRPSVAEDDGLHYSTAGLLRIGERYAAALAAAEANTLTGSLKTGAA